jgi:hypothetical protein
LRTAKSTYLTATDMNRCRVKAANSRELSMRYTLLIAAAAILASTGAGLAKSDHHRVHHARPGYADVQSQSVPPQRSWLELEHELDPCHCDGGAP